MKTSNAVRGLLAGLLRWAAGTSGHATVTGPGMMQRMAMSLCALAVVLGSARQAQAELVIIGQAQFSGTGPSYNLIWDNDSYSQSGSPTVVYGPNVWLDYDRPSATWDSQMAWANSLNTAGALTYTIDPPYSVTWAGGWRLPKTPAWATWSCGHPQLPCDLVDKGFKPERSGEMGHLYYTELGNLAGGVGVEDYNNGPFLNVNLQNKHWSQSWDCYDVCVSGQLAWYFNFYDGSQDLELMRGNDGVAGYNFFNAIAVRSADVVVVPVDDTDPVITCPANPSVAVGSLPTAATDAEGFISQGGTIHDSDPAPTVTSADSSSGACPIVITRTYTVTDAAGNSATCGQTITVNNLFAADGIIWHQPLARNGMSEDTDPGNGNRLKYRFKLGSTIPIQVHAQGCSADVTANANVTGTVVVFGDTDMNGVIDSGELSIDYNGVGEAGGVMDKIDGHLKFNLDTKKLVQTFKCYILQVTITDSSTGESVVETVPLQSR